MAEQYFLDKHICNGWLYKRGKRKTWKKRWFVLRDSQLTYYKDDKEYKPKDIISTSDIMAVAMLTDDNKPNHFAFFTPNKNYHLRAETIQEAESWVEKLKLALDRASQKALSSSFTRLNVLDSVAENEHNGRNMIHVGPMEFRTSQTFNTFPNKPTVNLAKRHSINGPVGNLSGNIQRLKFPPIRPSFDSNNVSNSVDSNTTSLNAGSLFSGKDAAQSSCTSDYGSPVNKKQADFGMQQRQPLPELSQQPSINDEDDDSFIQPPTNSSTNISNNADINISNTIESVQNILETGFLLRFKRRYKQWRNQYVILTNNKIEFYKNERSKTPLKMIPIEDLIDVVELDAISKSKQFCMQLITPEKRIKFCAPSEDELIRWLAAIKAIIDASPSTATISYDLIEEE